MSVRSSLMRVYWKCAEVIVPGLRHSQDLYEESLGELVARDTRWLDVGCGHQVLPEWRLEAERALVGRAERVVGLDRDLPSLQRHVTLRELVYGDVGALPFAAESFTLVSANMVVEHLERPEMEFAEVWRVLEPGGRFVFHTPNLEGYIARLASMVPERLKVGLIGVLEGRAANDVFPTHYRANTLAAIEATAKRAGFEVERVRLILTTAQTAAVPPLALFELLWIRALMSPKRRRLRTNIIAVLRKPERASAR